MGSLKSLNKYLYKYRGKLLLGVFFVTVSVIFGILPAVFVGESFDVVYNAFQEYQADSNYDLGGLKNSLLLFGLIIIGSSLLKGVFMFFMRQTIIVVSRYIEYDMKNEIFEQYQNLSLAFYKRNNTGDLMNRISEDVSRVRMYLGPAIMYTINVGISLILIITIMFSINVRLSIFVLTPLPILSVAIYYVSRKINIKSEQVQRQLSAISTHVQEAFSGIRVLKSYVREDHSLDTFSSEANTYLKKNEELYRINALFFPLMVLLIGLSTILTIYIGGQEVMAGNIAFGEIPEFIFYVNMLTWPVASIGWVTSLVQRAAASQTRINEFLDVTPEITNHSSEALSLDGKVEFRGVSFKYPDTGIQALKDVSFVLPAGKTLAIIGHTGSGKSTIANLIGRLYDVNSGEILIDNKPIESLNLSQLRRSIGYVPQEAFLFSDSIARNIAFGVGDVGMDRIELAAKNAEVHHNIIEFPKSYDTRVGERGITLSGGQKQRVSIARAIIKDPTLMIFDDCLSAVDTETEESILKNLRRIIEKRTTLIISHRVSSVKHADEILVLDSGEIIEKGTHDQLLHDGGYYKRMYEQQLIEDARKAV